MESTQEKAQSSCETTPSSSPSPQPGEIEQLRKRVGHVADAVNHNAQIAFECVVALQVQNRALRMAIEDMVSGRIRVVSPGVYDHEAYVQDAVAALKAEDAERTSTMAPPNTPTPAPPLADLQK
jgi:starvation-inducible outer membrane lipoprotein